MVQPTIAKLQILTLATKLLVLSPNTPLLNQLSQYLFTLARYDQDYDTRDRARFLNALLRGVRDDKMSKAAEDDDKSGGTVAEDEVTDMGGVVLRREQVKVVLLSQRSYADEKAIRVGDEYTVGSMSRLIGRKLAGYEALPEWTDDPTDPSLRDSELDDPRRSAPAPSAISSSFSQPISAASASASATPLPVHLSSAASLPRGGSPAGSSPAGSLPAQARSKFQDLDAFLNSESEESTEDESDRSVSMSSSMTLADCSARKRSLRQSLPLPLHRPAAMRCPSMTRIYLPKTNRPRKSPRTKKKTAKIDRCMAIIADPG